MLMRLFQNCVFCGAASHPCTEVTGRLYLCCQRRVVKSLNRIGAESLPRAPNSSAMVGGCLGRHPFGLYPKALVWFRMVRENIANKFCSAADLPAVSTSRWQPAPAMRSIEY